MKRILPLLLALSASPLLAYLPVTNSARTTPAALQQLGPVVASNGFDFLTAWTTVGPNSDTVIYTQRIGADGSLAGDLPRPLDPTASSFAPDAHTHPHGVGLTPARDGYFLSWLSDAGLNAAIVDAFGAVLHNVTLQHKGWSGDFTLAAWNGSAHLVLSGFVGPFSATLFDNNGSVIAADVPIGDTHADSSVRTAVTADDSGFLVLSTKTIGNRADIYGRRISSSGAAGEWFLVRSLIDVPTGLSVTSDGGRDIVAWSDHFGIWTMPVDAHTNEAGASRQLVSANVFWLGNPLWQAGRLWIGYTDVDESRSRIVTVGPDGVITEPLSLTYAQNAPALAASNSRVLSVRQVLNELSANDVIANFVTPDAATPDFAAARSLATQQNGDMTTDGTRLVSVWSEVLPPEEQIFLSLINPAVPAQAKEVQVSTSGNNRTPAVARNAANYLVVWEHWPAGATPHIYARRFSGSGDPLDSREIDLGEGSAPHVASDGTNWLVVWTRYLPGACPFGNGGAKLHGARIAADGTSLDGSGVLLSAGGPEQYGADLVWSGTEYVLAWQNICQGYHTPTVTSIGLATLSPDLSHIASTTVTGASSSSQRISFGTPRVAAVPGQIVVAWRKTSASADSPAGFTTVTEYRFLTGAAPPSRRMRAAALKQDAAIDIDATLVGLGHDASGQFFMLGQMIIPTAPAYTGLFRWNLSSGGAENAGMRFVTYGEQFTGRPALAGNTWWVLESWFSTSAGSFRMFVRDLI